MLSIYYFSILLAFLGCLWDRQIGHEKTPSFYLCQSSLQDLHMTALSHPLQITWSNATFLQMTQQFELNYSSSSWAGFAFYKSFYNFSWVRRDISLTYSLKSSSFSVIIWYGFSKSLMLKDSMDKVIKNYKIKNY